MQKAKRRALEVDWDVPELPIPRPTIPVLVPGPGGRLKAVLLGERVVSVGIHWLDDYKRTLPCKGKHKGCPLCVDDPFPRWEAFIDAWNTGRGLCLVKLTACAVNSCPRLADKSQSLRGLELTLSRCGKRANGRIVAVLNAAPPSMSGPNLPNAINVKDALQRIWQGESKGRNSPWSGQPDRKSNLTSIAQPDQSDVPY